MPIRPWVLRNGAWQVAGLGTKKMKKLSILIGVSAAAFLGPFTQTIYTPNLPELRDYFHVDTVLINLTISLFTAVLAFSNFVIGPIADRRGRRITALVGLLVFALGSLICLLAPSYGYFLTGRIVQAAGISTGSLIAVAVIGDLYPPQERGKAMSFYQTLTFLGPVLGPVIGGGIAAYLSWRWAFGFLVLAGLATWLYSSVYLKETRPEDLAPVKFNLSTLRGIVGQRSAAALFLLAFSQFFAYYVFLVYLPSLLATLFDVPMASRGIYFVPLTLGILLGINLGGRWNKAGSGAHVISVCSFALGAGALLFFAGLALHWVSLPVLLVFLALFGVLLGISLPMQTTLLVNLFKKERATATGLYNFCRFGGASAGPLAGGLIERVSSTNSVFLSLGVLLLISAIFVQRGLKPSPASV